MVPFASYVNRGQSKPWLIFSRINGPNVLLAYLLAHIASLIAIIEINFVILATTISHFIQIVESFSSRPRHAKRLGLWRLLIFLSNCRNTLLRGIYVNTV